MCFQHLTDAFIDCWDSLTMNDHTMQWFLCFVLHRPSLTPCCKAKESSLSICTGWVINANLNSWCKRFKFNKVTHSIYDWLWTSIRQLIFIQSSIIHWFLSSESRMVGAQLYHYLLLMYRCTEFCPVTDTRENSQTFSLYLCYGILLHADVWIVVQVAMTVGSGFVNIKQVIHKV